MSHSKNTSWRPNVKEGFISKRIAVLHNRKLSERMQKTFKVESIITYKILQFYRKIPSALIYLYCPIFTPRVFFPLSHLSCFALYVKYEVHIRIYHSADPLSYFWCFCVLVYVYNCHFIVKPSIINYLFDKFLPKRFSRLTYNNV